MVASPVKLLGSAAATSPSEVAAPGSVTVNSVPPREIYAQIQPRDSDSTHAERE